MRPSGFSRHQGVNLSEPDVAQASITSRADVVWARNRWNFVRLSRLRSITRPCRRGRESMPWRYVPKVHTSTTGSGTRMRRSPRRAAGRSAWGRSGTRPTGGCAARPWRPGSPRRRRERKFQSTMTAESRDWRFYHHGPIRCIQDPHDLFPLRESAHPQRTPARA